jgi:hypothetical protein
LWPHARPWKVEQPEPTLRCIKEGSQCAEILKKAWLIENQGQEAYSKADNTAKISKIDHPRKVNSFNNESKEAFMNRAIQS